MTDKRPLTPESGREAERRGSQRKRVEDARFTRARATTSERTTAARHAFGRIFVRTPCACPRRLGRQRKRAESAGVPGRADAEDLALLVCTGCRQLAATSRCAGRRKVLFQGQRCFVVATDRYAAARRDRGGEVEYENCRGRGPRFKALEPRRARPARDLVGQNTGAPQARARHHNHYLHLGTGRQGPTRRSAGAGRGGPEECYYPPHPPPPPGNCARRQQWDAGERQADAYGTFPGAATRRTVCPLISGSRSTTFGSSAPNRRRFGQTKVGAYAGYRLLRRRLHRQPASR